MSGMNLYQSLYRRHRNLAVRHKLRLVIMTAVTAALVCACAAVLTYDRFAAREAMRSDLEVMAEMLGGNSTAALTFEDAQDGKEILSALRAKRQIVAAQILNAGGRPLASYRRSSSSTSVMPPVRPDGAWFEPGRLILFRRD